MKNKIYGQSFPLPKPSQAKGVLGGPKRELAPRPIQSISCDVRGMVCVVPSVHTFKKSLFTQIDKVPRTE